MNEHTLKVLEFDCILDLLKGFASSDLGKSQCESMKPQKEINVIETLLDEVSELKEVLQVHGGIPIDGIRDVEKYIIGTSAEGSILDPFEFLDILSTLKAAHRIKKFFKKLKDHAYPLVKEMGSGLIFLPDIEHKIEKSIGERGEILDSASPRLGEIRRKLRRIRAKIQTSLENLHARDSLQSVFQERIITIRNGRYVIPVKSDFKGHIQGIIHDHSHSKATYFIEPISTIEANNELGMLFKEEKNEELRVLKNLTDSVQNDAQGILSNLKLLEKVDLTYAKAGYSIELNARKPVLNREGRVNLVNSYHPLLLSLRNGKENTVSIDIHFDKGCNSLIITGANTGGKTVALKTMGILTLMVQSGMHIPVADYSEAAVFDSVFADIGDDQAIDRNLSTFSSHISHVVEILHKANESSLVLLDEIGVGTDPDEGAALAMALLDYLRGKGAHIIATTHLNLLKAYAYLHDDIMNVSVGFDTDTMKPYYSLIYGAPGESNALVIAERLGIPREILDRAKGFIENKNGHIARLIRALEGSQRDVIEEKKGVQKLKEVNLAYQRQIESLLELLRGKEESILLETEAKARAFLKKTEEEARKIIEGLRKKEKDGGEDGFSGIDQRFHHLEEELKLFKPSRKRGNHGPLPSELKKGDVVWITPLKKKGVVVDVREDSDQVSVHIGNLKVKVCLNNIEQAKGDRAKDSRTKEEFVTGPHVVGATHRINVIGMRVDDALPLVDKAIDNALLGGITRMDVIHGIGTGRLKEAIQKHLRDHSFVTAFGSADLSQGGAGATVVEIKV